MAKFPLARPRRLRDKTFIRRLTAETTLSAADMIWPLFVHEEEDNAPVAAMPGVERLGEDGLWRAAERAVALGIPMIALFPVVPAAKKDDSATEALNPEGLIPKITAGLKTRFPELGIMTDIALDPYTSHGQDGLINAAGDVINDETVAVLARQAVLHASAGVDVVAPSDMMDGRIIAIRQALEAAGRRNTKILSYAAKYASAFYGPFRDAVGSSSSLGKSDKRTYQMSPANRKEALREIAMDIEEGADMVMIKPGLAYLDIVRDAADFCNVPVAVYQVSGEYAMLHAAADNGWLDLRACVRESLLAFKRAGAAAILTYFAPMAAENLVVFNTDAQ